MSDEGISSGLTFVLSAQPAQAVEHLWDVTLNIADSPKQQLDHLKYDKLYGVTSIHTPQIFPSTHR